MALTPEEIKALELEAVTLGEKLVKEGKVKPHEAQHKGNKGGKSKGGKK